MHIEPGLISPEKILLSYGTAAASLAVVGKYALDHLKERGASSLILNTSFATLSVFIFFEVLVHVPVGVSEVHFILGTSLFLLLGAAPSGLGMVLGLLAQGVFFAPADLPQYTANITTLLVPLFMMARLARRIIPRNLAYVDLGYAQVLHLSLAYQGGIIAWVAFWAVYGQGFVMANLSAVATFGVASLSVVLVEPFVDLGLLAIAKVGAGSAQYPFVRMLFNPRLYDASNDVDNS